ncbi:zinc transporter ZIP9 isoform X2 [Aphelenchoides besseyi]|nr:zinc transporter ZIP9 isoform X2 [Aphelenchoides besseyi]
MFEGFAFFSALCVTMFFASYFIGFLPLLGNLGEQDPTHQRFWCGSPHRYRVFDRCSRGYRCLASNARTGDALEVAIAKEANGQSAAGGKDDELKRHLRMHLGGRRKLSTTIGLCVHALADGVLLGSASSTRNSEVQMVVFVALVIHKGPSAFALSSLLLMENLERFRIKRHLLIFSLSAPFGAITTYMFLAAVKEGADYSTNLSGMFMLFSAGTFVYVAAAHVLPELESSSNECCPQTSGPLRVANSPSGLSLKEMVVLMLGALAPAQRRYDNMRIRENEIQHRVCFDCGRVVHGNDMVFQHHMVTHEAAFICYQLYHFEKGTTMPRSFAGKSTAILTKQQHQPANMPSKKSKKEKSLREKLEKQMMKRGSTSIPMLGKSRFTSSVTAPKLNRFGEPAKKRGRKPKNLMTLGDQHFINDRPMPSKAPKEPNLSEDESENSYVTDSDQGSEISFKDEVDIEMPVDDDFDEDYVPASMPSTSSRGRPRKPKFV